MLDHIVVFMYHKNDDITYDHYQRFASQSVVIPLTSNYSGAPLPNTVDVSLEPTYWNCSDPWASIDTQLYRWATSKAFIESKRYIIVEWDCLLIGNLREFYSNVWNEDAAANLLKVRNRDKWYWFHKTKGCYGMVPFAGCLLSNRTLKQVTEEVIQPQYYNEFCEARLATAIKQRGIEIKEMQKEGFLHASRKNHPKPELEGLYHPIKEFL